MCWKSYNYVSSAYCIAAAICSQSLAHMHAATVGLQNSNQASLETSPAPPGYTAQSRPTPLLDN